MLLHGRLSVVAFFVGIWETTDDRCLDSTYFLGATGDSPQARKRRAEEERQRQERPKRRELMLVGAQTSAFTWKTGARQKQEAKRREEEKATESKACATSCLLQVVCRQVRHCTGRSLRRGRPMSSGFWQRVCKSH